LIRPRPELLHVLDDEPDAIHRNTRLVRHFKLYRRWSRLHLGFDRLKDLLDDFGTHSVISTEPSPAVTGDWIVCTIACGGERSPAIHILLILLVMISHKQTTTGNQIVQGRWTQAPFGHNDLDGRTP
jgi:hypothetical protein